MIQAEAKMKKRHEPSYMIVSSESENDSRAHNRIDDYKAVINEYLGIGPKQSSWHKALIQARVEK